MIPVRPLRRGRPPKETSHPVGSYLRRRRESLGLTTRDLAVRAGLNPSSASYFSQLESGAKAPSRGLARRLAEILGEDDRIYLAWAEMGKRNDPVAHVRARHLLALLLGEPRLEVQLASGYETPTSETAEEQAHAPAAARPPGSRMEHTSARGMRSQSAFPAGEAALSARSLRPAAARKPPLGDEVPKLQAGAERAEATRAWVPIPEIREGADPGEDPRAPQDVITVHRVRAETLEGMEPLRHPFAYWITVETARHLRGALLPRDVAILTRRVLPLDPGQPHAIRVEGSVLLRFVKWNGRHLLLVGEREEDFIAVEAPDESTLGCVLAGKVVAAIPVHR